MTYETVIDQIQSKRRFGSACGKEVISSRLLQEQGLEEGLCWIHIAGTNGKGSVAAFLSSMLEAASFRVGVFTSPHLIDFCERIRVNGELITKEAVVKYGEELLQQQWKIEGTMFDYCLLIALKYFKEQRCDVVILETGLGGRLDSTSGIHQVPVVSVITNVGLDHTQYLGDTIPAIAKEKAGIMRTGTVAVLGEMQPDARKVIERECELLGVSIFDNTVVAKSEDVGMAGSYQIENATTAGNAFLAFCKEYWKENEIDWNKIHQWIKVGWRKAVWSGRFEIISHNPFLLVDGAHNLQGVEGLKKSLQQEFPEERFIFLVSVMADKDYSHMMKEMIALSQEFITVCVSKERGLHQEKLAELLRQLGGNAKAASDVKQAMELAVSSQKRNHCKIVAFGSLYFIGDFLSVGTELLS